MRRLALIALLVATNLGTALAAKSPDVAWKDFLSLARKEAAGQPIPPQALAASSLTSEAFRERLIQSIDRIETSALTAPLTPEVVQQAVNSLAYTIPSVRLTQTGNTLLATLVAEREANRAHYRTEVGALLEKSSKACLAAKVASDLDATLAALVVYQRSADGSDSRDADPAMQSRAANLYTFVKTWQDYLNAREAGQVEQTTSHLYNLAQSVDPSLFARSQILSLPRLPRATRVPSEDTPVALKTAVESNDIAPVLDRLATSDLDALEKIAADLTALRQASSPDPALNDIAGQIQALVNARQSLAQGQISLDLFTRRASAPESNRLNNRYYTEKYSAALQRLQTRLQRESLHVVFKDSGLPQNSDESTDAYILRVAQAAAAAENWEYALRTLEFYRAFYTEPTMPAWTSRELASCTTYVAARRLDEARQFPQAILAYHDALRVAGRLTPVKVITARLDALRTSNPDAFAAAARLPRPVVYYQPNLSNRYPGQSPMNRDSTYLVPRTERPFTP